MSKTLRIQTPTLVVETPRLGRWNHVTLLPTGFDRRYGVDAMDTAGFACSSRRISGDRWVAAFAEVEQWQSSRRGVEVMVLTGIKIPEDVETRAAIQNWLCDKMTEVEQIVLAGGAWDAHNGGSLQLPELAAWAAEAVAKFGLEPAERPGRPGRFRRLVRRLVGR